MEAVQEEEEAVVSELKERLEAGDLNPEQKLNLLNTGINSETATSVTTVTVIYTWRKWKRKILFVGPETGLYITTRLH